MIEVERKEIKELYSRYAKQELIDCNGMYQEKEYEYSKKNQKKSKKN